MIAAPIKLIVGLGNPGEKYAKTRHNAGFLFLDTWLRRHYPSELLRPDKNLLGNCVQLSLGGQAIRLLAPTTFMNLSGNSVQAALSYYKLEPSQMLVVHDELDLPPGIARLKLGGGHGGNNGLRHITQMLGSGDFARLRLGIGHPGVGRDVANYVLKTANVAEHELLEHAIDESIAVMEDVVRGDFAGAMNQLHTRLAQKSNKSSAAESVDSATKRRASSEQHADSNGTLSTSEADK